MAEHGGRGATYETSIFFNCPFDQTCKPIFEALVRAERADAEAGALREQLVQLTATLREKSVGATAGGRRGVN